MTDRIDHAGEAINYLGSAVIDTHGDDDRKVAIAQVHATLALVEQQRIANVIDIAIEQAAQGYRGQWISDKHPDIAAALGVKS